MNARVQSERQTKTKEEKKGNELRWTRKGRNATNGCAHAHSLYCSVFSFSSWLVFLSLSESRRQFAKGLRQSCLEAQAPPHWGSFCFFFLLFFFRFSFPCTSFSSFFFPSFFLFPFSPHTLLREPGVRLSFFSDLLGVRITGVNTHLPPLLCFLFCCCLFVCFPFCCRRLLLCLTSLFFFRLL